MNGYPARIVCLSALAAQTLRLLGEQRRMLAISGFELLSAEEYRGISVVHGTAAERMERICALGPDLVLGGGIGHTQLSTVLAGRGIAVHVSRQETVRDVLDTIRVLGGMVGRAAEASHLVSGLEHRIGALRNRRRSTDTASEGRPPRVYLSCEDVAPDAVGWLREVMEIVGGRYCGSEWDAHDTARLAPDIIIGCRSDSWRPPGAASRTGWKHVPAVRNGELYEIPASQILQPGPVALLHGLEQLSRIIDQWYEHRTRLFQTAISVDLDFLPRSGAPATFNTPPSP